MALLIAKGLPACEELRAEGLEIIEKDTVCPDETAGDAVRIAILNLMPTKEATERQLLRVLGSGRRNIDVTFLHTETHEAKNAAQEHLQKCYTVFSKAKELRFDGLIVTGAPVEMLPFEDVDYWQELLSVMDWADGHVKSSFYICWAAQAALWHFYSIGKHVLPEKCFGIFEHELIAPGHKLAEGFPKAFPAPHSRHTHVLARDINAAPGLQLLAQSDIAGVYIAASGDGRRVFVTGHSEYEPDTLQREYERDVAKGLPIHVPHHYFPDDDPAKEPPLVWREHSIMLYQNWIENCICK